MQHADKDKKSHMLKHMLQYVLPSVSPNNFRILRKGYNNSKVKRNISEALLIRKHQPSLNIHENLVALELLIDVHFFSNFVIFILIAWRCLTLFKVSVFERKFCFN